MLDIGQKIRFLREQHGLKQINLANALQVTPQAVSKWERGTNYPDIPLLLRIAALFDVSIDYLLGTTEAGSGLFVGTVFCTGIKHFAKRSIAMDSREFTNYVNVVFYHLTESVLKYDAIPVKYLGDGFLCFFAGPGHADRAVTAAIHARNVVAEKDLVVSLNSGDLYVGRVGHPDYASRDIVGETVNRAFLVLDYVARHCASGIGATDAVMKLAQGHYHTAAHAGVAIDLINETVAVHEIHLS